MTASASMFLYLILVGVFVDTESKEQCFNNLTSFQCSCVDDIGFTPFWHDHYTLKDDKWEAKIFPTRNSCTEKDVINFITHNNSTDSEGDYQDKDLKMPTEQKMISQGYVKNGNSVYKFHSKKTFWDRARRICIGEGAHLAIPNSDRELKFLTKYLSRDNDRAFIGMHDILNEGEHVTMFGEPASIAYTDFDENLVLSNHRLVGLGGEDCLAIRNLAFIEDLTCGFGYSFFCELELDVYPPLREIDYNNGPYKGVESSTVGPKRKVERIAPPAGYEFYPGFGSYRFHTTPQNWESARHVCEMEGGHLAIINSVFEETILLKYFQYHVLIPGSEIDDIDRAHIGFHDMYKEGSHVTLSNETLEEAGFSKWFEPGQPDNAKSYHCPATGAGSVGQNCGVLHRVGGFDDYDCDKVLAYFCEIEGC